MELIDDKVIKRFFSKVNIPEENLFDCWEWTAYKTTKGYGQFTFKNKEHKAHRISYLIWNKKFPTNFACHSCDNRLCVNPLHLWDGTNQQNIQDMVNKNRLVNKCFVKGSNHSNSKLTEEDVLAIRNEYNRKSYKVSNKNELAAKYGVEPCNITRIISRKSWSHI